MKRGHFFTASLDSLQTPWNMDSSYEPDEMSLSTAKSWMTEFAYDNTFTVAEGVTAFNNSGIQVAPQAARALLYLDQSAQQVRDRMLGQSYFDAMNSIGDHRIDGLKHLQFLLGKKNAQRTKLRRDMGEFGFEKPGALLLAISQYYHNKCSEPINREAIGDRQMLDVLLDGLNWLIKLQVHLQMTPNHEKEYLHACQITFDSVAMPSNEFLIGATDLYLKKVDVSAIGTKPIVLFKGLTPGHLCIPYQMGKHPGRCDGCEITDAWHIKLYHWCFMCGKKHPGITCQGTIRRLLAPAKGYTLQQDEQPYNYGKSPRILSQDPKDPKKKGGKQKQKKDKLQFQSQKP